MYLNSLTKSSRLTYVIAGLFGTGTTRGFRQPGSEYTNSRIRNQLFAAQVHSEPYRRTASREAQRRHHRDGGQHHGNGACVNSTAPGWVADRKSLKPKWLYIYQSIRGRYRQHSDFFRYHPKGMIGVGYTNRPANRTKSPISIRQLRFIYISAIAECRHRQRQYDHGT